MAVAAGVCVRVAVAVWVRVGVLVTVGVRLAVAVAVRVGVGVTCCASLTNSGSVRALATASPMNAQTSISRASTRR